MVGKKKDTFDMSLDNINLRDYFAGQALMGLLGSIPKSLGYGDIQSTSDQLVATVYYIADAMLAERANST